MTEVAEQAEKPKTSVIEVATVMALIAIITIGAIVFMGISSRASHLSHRRESIEATASVSAQNKAVTDGYLKCWGDTSLSASPRCALEAAALGGSQGRTVEGVSELMGSMGIFENGCVDPDNSNVLAVQQNAELANLMATWCLTHTPETKTEAEAPVH